MSAVLFALLLLASSAFAQSTTSAPKELDIPGDSQWTDTGIDLKPGDTLKIAATGTLHFSAAKENGPEGLARGWMDLLRILPFNGAGRGALVGRIGANDAARPFLIGPRAGMKAPVDGRLFLGV